MVTFTERLPRLEEDRAKPKPDSFYVDLVNKHTTKNMVGPRCMHSILLFEKRSFFS